MTKVHVRQVVVHLIDFTLYLFQ